MEKIELTDDKFIYAEKDKNGEYYAAPRNLASQSGHTLQYDSSEKTYRIYTGDYYQRQTVKIRYENPLGSGDIIYANYEINMIGKKGSTIIGIGLHSEDRRLINVNDYFKAIGCDVRVVGNGDAYSDKLIELLKDYEDFSPVLYDANYSVSKSPAITKEYVKNNPNGDFTIGYGTKVWTTEDSKHYIGNFYGVTLTKNQAHALMIEELDEETLPKSLIPLIEKHDLSLSQRQFDALVLFTYQFGEYTWSEDTKYTSIRNFVINGDYSESKFKGVMKNYKGSKAKEGTVARVNDVIELFIDGDYERDYNYDRN